MLARRAFRVLVSSIAILAALGLTALPASAVTLNVDYDFGQAPAVPFDGSITVTNSLVIPGLGGVSVKPTSLSVTTEDPADVAGVDAPGCLNQTIAPGDSCQAQLHLIPSSLGTHFVHILVAGDIEGMPTLFDFDIRVKIELVAPDIDLGTVSLGDLELGVPQTAGRPFTNVYADSVTLSDLDASVGGPDAADVTSTDLSDCETTLAIGDSCTPAVSLTPTHLGAEQADITVTGKLNGIPSTIRFTATANVVPRLMHTSPPSVGFGSFQTGGTTLSTTVTLANTSGVGATTVSAAVVGAGADQFVASNDSCAGGSLAAGGSCSVDVAFAPTAHGAQVASVRFTTDVARNLSIDVPLSAFGTAPSVAPSPSSLAYPDTQNGETSAAKVVTLHNSGDAPLLVSSFGVTGEDASAFSVTDETCIGHAVAPGSKCAVAVAFSPAAIGEADATLAIHDDAIGGIDTLPLTGKGTPSADRSVTLKASPSPVHAGAPLTYMLTARNLGPNTATGVRVVLTLPADSAFVSLAGAACSSPAPGDDGVVSCSLGKLAPGASTVITVVVDAPSSAHGSAFHSAASVRSSTFDPVSQNNRVRRRTKIA